MNGAFTRRQGCADSHAGAGALMHSQQPRLRACLQTTARAHSSQADLSAHSGSS